MGGQNWKVNPATRDYLLENGAPVPTDRIEEQAYFILTMPDNWMYAEPGDGSKLYRLKNSKRTSTTDQLYAGMVEDALNRQLVAPGRASSVKVSNVESTRNATSNQIDITQLQRAVSTKLAFNPI